MTSKKTGFVATVILTLGLFSPLAAQTPRNPLPRIINVPGKNHISPSLSGDGKHLVFVSNYSVSGKMTLKYSSLTGTNQWSVPVELTSISRTQLDFIGGHSLSYDGTLLFFTSKRSPSIGNFDIFYCERNGEQWSEPHNVGKPVNSEGNEGHASLSADGRFLYFMRCNEMDIYNANGCELYVAERKSDNYWHEPVKLPYPVNTGNEATPRILADGETLIFASTRPGGKGGFDLYQTRNVSGEWTRPRPYSFLNSENDDLYVNVPAHGELVFYSNLFRGYHTIISAKIPGELQPKKVVLVQGRFTEKGSKKPLEGVLQVYNARTKEREQFIKTRTDGSFFALLKGGEIYDFSVIGRENRHVYYSRLYNLTHLDESVIEEMDLEQPAVLGGLSFHAKDILFEPYSSIISAESEVALLRLAKFLRDNPGMKIEVGAYLREFRSDSIPGDPDLTEALADTVYDESADTVYDGSAGLPPDSLLMPDSLAIPGFEEDSAGAVKPGYYVRYTWHNDRTEKQAQAVIDRLLDLGAPSYLLSAKTYRETEVTNIDPQDRQDLLNGSIIITIVSVDER